MHNVIEEFFSDIVNNNHSFTISLRQSQEKLLQRIDKIREKIKL